MSKKFSIIISVCLCIIFLTSSIVYGYSDQVFGSRMLKYGSNGSDVRITQDVLNYIGFSAGVSDGYFGVKTQDAVIRLQKYNGLTPDGIVGSYTFAAISNAEKKPLSAILKAKGIPNQIPNLIIYINKSNQILALYSGTTFLKSYHIALGDSGLGDKVQAGDHKTPEGTFYICQKLVYSNPDQYLGTRWMRLSYPNIEDAQRGLNSGLINQETYNQIVTANNNKTIPPQNTALGGGVGIHGGNDTNGEYTNWTFGCVALKNTSVNEIYDYVTVGTKVIIHH